MNTAANNFRVKTMKSRYQSLEAFDRLPRRVKEIVWYLPYKASASANATEAALPRALLAFSEDTARVYGWDHPGADLARRAKFRPSSALEDFL